MNENFDWQDRLWAERLDYAEVGALSETTPRATPTRLQKRVVDDAVKYAWRHLPKLPKKLQIGYHYAPGITRGTAIGGANVAVPIIRLNLAEIRDIFPLREVVLHECRHLHDFATSHALSRGQLEVLAMRFAEQGMRDWQPPSVWDYM